MIRIRTAQLLVAAVLLLSGAARAQQCDDFDQCTANDICSDGVCSGSFQTGGSCDDGNPCTMNDRCRMDPDQGTICVGSDPAPIGTSCDGGCGTCQQLAPVPGMPLQCVGDPGVAGAACDVGMENGCVSGSCVVQTINEFNFVLCFPQITVCDDTDGNPCTDGCNFQTGECEVNVGHCIPDCETCNPSNGACEPANVGGACDDFDVCTSESRCETNDAAQRTFCVAGPSSGPTCVGDCNNNRAVGINELILGVSISLGNAQIDQCRAFDSNSNDKVEINELIGGVNSSLQGCTVARA